MGYNSDYRGTMRFEGGDSLLLNKILGEDKRDLERRYPHWKPALDKMKNAYSFDLEEGVDEFLYNGNEKAYNQEEALQAIIDIHNIEGKTILIYGRWIVYTDEGSDPYVIDALGDKIAIRDLNVDSLADVDAPAPAAKCPHCGGKIGFVKA